ncbi:hypothetical protein L195_g044240, partial [Trifolium pratense]
LIEPPSLITVSRHTTTVHQMALRGVWQLKKLVVSFSYWGGSGKGISIRGVIETWIKRWTLKLSPNQRKERELGMMRWTSDDVHERSTLLLLELLASC